MSQNFKRYCKDYENIENYDKAKKDNFVGWDCHHRLETHNSDGERREVDISYKELQALGVYYNRPAGELMFLTRSEHNALHKVSAETRRKISEAHKGKYAGENNPMYGKHHSDEVRKKMSHSWDYDKHFSAETRKKMSTLRKGRRWFNNGKESKFCFECPDGFTPGRLRTNKSLTEYLDRTGKHVSAKTLEKYKGEKKSFAEWESLI